MYRETLPNGVSYEVLDAEPKGGRTTPRSMSCPPGNYFMMGDNRDNSQDSRYSDVVGFVPYENFVGRADLIFFSIEARRLAVGSVEVAVRDSLGALLQHRQLTPWCALTEAKYQDIADRLGYEFKDRAFSSWP